MKRFLLPILAFLFLLASCTTSSPRSRGSLSDAMEKSRDDYEEERTVPDEEDEDWFSEPEEEEPPKEAPAEPEEPQSEGAEEEPLPESSLAPRDIFLLLRSGSSFVSNPYFHNPFDMEMLLGGQGNGHGGAYLFTGFKTLKVQSGDGISGSVKSRPFLLHLGMEFRFYPFEEWTYLAPYVTGRIAGFTLFWSYKNSLTAGGDTISSDYLGGVGFDGGAGIDFVRTETFQAGILLLPQSFLFGEETFQGFENDVFDAYGTVRWTLEAGFRV